MHVVQFLHLLSINRGGIIPQSVKCGFLLETCWWSFRAFRSFCLITNFLFFTYNYVCIFCLLQMVYMRKVLQMRRLRYWRMIIIILQCIGNYPGQSTRKGAMWVPFVILSQLECLPPPSTPSIQQFNLYTVCLLQESISRTIIMQMEESRFQY